MPAVLKLFSGTHPKVVQDWLPAAEGIFQADPNHQLTSREKKHRRMLWLEKTFGLQFNKKHYRLVRLKTCSGRRDNRQLSVDDFADAGSPVGGATAHSGCWNGTQAPGCCVHHQHHDALALRHGQCTRPLSPPSMSVDSCIEPGGDQQRQAGGHAKIFGAAPVPTPRGPPVRRRKSSARPRSRQCRATARKFSSGQFFCGVLVNGWMNSVGLAGVQFVVP